MKRLLGSIAAVAASAFLAAQPLLAAPAFGNSAFQRVWSRQDWVVSQSLTDRSWTWGPAPISETVRESYVEGIDSKRSVQYFDKSRMEINDPTVNQNSKWYVTNGLLPIELMSGRMQVGNSRFEYRGPARVSAIGDPGNFPTYADLLPLYQSPGTVNPNDIGKPATGFLNTNGSISGFNDFASDPNTVLIRGENSHGVAKVFVDFMNQRGLVADGQSYIDQVYDPLFVFGYPVTGAFWVKAKVGGKEVPILFQVFERRVLTYNPANSPAFRVEMGNVGQHYYQWRYTNK